MTGTKNAEVSDLDDAAISNALDHADMNVLRMALLHATGDHTLEGMKVDKVPLRGGTFFAYRLAAEHHDTVRAMAKRWLRTVRTEGHFERKPGDRELRGLMETMTGVPVSDRLFRFGRDELAIDDFPRSAAWTADRPSSADDFHVVIIGAGASGIAAAVQLHRLGVPFTVIERQDGIGGTWNINVYPDARVDVNSYLYQFKFVKNYPWTSYYAPQEDVRRYLEHVAHEFGVADRIRFGTEVGRATFDDAAQTWTLHLRDSSGRESALHANAVISAAGLFNQPKMPDIAGVETFGGKIFHSARWDRSFDPAGARIAVIGNGSTGVQVMPGLAGTAQSVHVFQRTPQWISPMEGYRDAVGAEARWLFENVPYYWNWYCYSAQVTSSSMQTAQVYDREWQAAGGAISRQNDALRENLTQYIKDKLGTRPDLIDLVTPDHAPLARRLVVDNGWYDALLRDNVELVTNTIERIDATGIVTTDGTRFDVDAIVLATGFDVARYLWPTEYSGRNGITLEEQWKADGPRTYLGMMVPNFPNLFIFYGPNAQPRSGALLTAVELWARFAAQSIATLIEHGKAAMDVTQDAFDIYNREVDGAQQELIWAAEAPRGRNYYVNRFGRQMLNVPWSNHDYSARLERPDLADFVLTGD